MHIIIKNGGAVFALRLGPADFRAIRSIVITAVLALHPASQPALAELKRAVAAQFVTWSPPDMPEIHAADITSGEVGPGEVR
jgi:hypothetical protein